MTQRLPVPCTSTVHASRGFVLIEALVALLIFAFGVLGVVGLQAAMTKAQTQSKFRADAAQLAQQVIGMMWADLPNLNNYATASCTGYAPCNSWVTHVASALPNGAATIGFVVIAPSTSPTATVTIQWTPPNEQQHNYTTTSFIVTP
jgi:type IV pilus assembly protein PilV